MTRRLQTAASILAVAAAYFCAGRFGLSLALVNPSASAIWPPTGLALAATLLWGYRLWPGIFLGAFLVNSITPGTPATDLGIAVGNTMEVLVGVVIFLGRIPSDQANQLKYLAILPLLWAAFRFRQRGASVCACVVSGIALWSTLQGLGPFVTPDPNQSLLFLQAFVGTMTLTTLVVAAVVSEGQRFEQRLRVKA